VSRGQRASRPLRHAAAGKTNWIAAVSLDLQRCIIPRAIAAGLVLVRVPSLRQPVARPEPVGDVTVRHRDAADSAAKLRDKNCGERCAFLLGSSDA
jgi:hypothetical protein